ncbi:hypothetical protein C3R75_00915 [Escherichia coli]|nr:hypothetical protein [Escherichia coli]EFO3079554.1 hypothetical protein [Escherichia coli O9]EGE2173455.1 hypothetical protein [Escherichia coli]PPE19924.1 hypothetical protein C3R75_00915 [Escherichia coli]PPV83552.1 hypothetical protein C5O94_21935 [Escherichia coli]
MPREHGWRWRFKSLFEAPDATHIIRPTGNVLNVGRIRRLRRIRQVTPNLIDDAPASPLSAPQIYYSSQ